MVPFLRESGDIDNDDLQSLWAQLLASAVEQDDDQHISFIHVLKQLSPTDALVLRTIIELGPPAIRKERDETADAAGISVGEAGMSVSNLSRLGFFTPTGKRLTGYAIHFVRACFRDQGELDVFLEKQHELKRAPIID